MSRITNYLVFVIFGMLGCFACTVDLRVNTPPQTLTTSSWRCDLTLYGYKEGDLVGKCQNHFRSGGNYVDIIVLQGDGTYQQSYTNFYTDYQYTSEWQEWWLELSESGGYQLHFEGMKFCGGISGTCVDPREIELGFYDYCEDNWLDLSGEFVLSAVKDASIPGEIKLRHMKPPGYDTYFVYYTRIE